MFLCSRYRHRDAVGQKSEEQVSWSDDRLQKHLHSLRYYLDNQNTLPEISNKRLRENLCLLKRNFPSYIAYVCNSREYYLQTRVSLNYYVAVTTSAVKVKKRSKELLPSKRASSISASFLNTLWYFIFKRETKLFNMFFSY